MRIPTGLVAMKKAGQITVTGSGAKWLLHVLPTSRSSCRAVRSTVRLAQRAWWTSGRKRLLAALCWACTRTLTLTLLQFGRHLLDRRLRGVWAMVRHPFPAFTSTR